MDVDNVEEENFADAEEDNLSDSEEEDLSSDAEADPLPDLDESPAEMPEEDGDDENGSYCVVCDKDADLPCERCDSEFFCCKEHLEEGLKEHGAESGVDNEEQPTDDVEQDSDLLRLPWEVLLLLCKHLSFKDLVDLGHTCRALRGLCRDVKAWEHVAFSSYAPYGMDKGFRAMRIAPALRSVSVGSKWPTGVNLRKCTPVVRELSLELAWGDPRYDEEEELLDVARVIRLLKHYKGYLQVLTLRNLPPREADTVKLLRAIDGLQILELHVDGQLVKAYPGSSKEVTYLSFGGSFFGYEFVSGAAVSNFLNAAQKTLHEFHVDDSCIHREQWTVKATSPVCRALQRCSALRRAVIPTWDYLPMLDRFPNLNFLCLLDFGSVSHKIALQFFKASPVMRQLDELTLNMGTEGHRGLLQAVAAGCTNLTALQLTYTSVDMPNHMSDDCIFSTDVPRDLHVILGNMTELEILSLQVVRVPFSFFVGLAGGALPNLRSLSLDGCGVTKKGRDALADLRKARPELKVWEDTHDAKGLPALFRRCPRSTCQEASDCEEEDSPISAQIFLQNFVNFFQVL